MWRKWSKLGACARISFPIDAAPSYSYKLLLKALIWPLQTFHIVFGIIKNNIFWDKVINVHICYCCWLEIFANFMGRHLERRDQIATKVSPIIANKTPKEDKRSHHYFGNRRFLTEQDAGTTFQWANTTISVPFSAAFVFQRLEFWIQFFCCYWNCQPCFNHIALNWALNKWIYCMVRPTSQVSWGGFV